MLRFISVAFLVQLCPKFGNEELSAAMEFSKIDPWSEVMKPPPPPEGAVWLGLEENADAEVDAAAVVLELADGRDWGCCPSRPVIPPNREPCWAEASAAAN
jgi:hypothetical protein